MGLGASDVTQNAMLQHTFMLSKQKSIPPNRENKTQENKTKTNERRYQLYALLSLQCIMHHV